MTTLMPRPQQVSDESGAVRPGSLAAQSMSAGAIAAAIPLIACVIVALVGWFLTDAGAVGDPADAVRVGANAWLVAHGSGVQIDGVPVTLMPLGITVVVLLMVWRMARRLGDALAPHGPDADRLGDGERDLTVPYALGLFSVSYGLTATLVATFAPAESAGVNVGRMLGLIMLAMVLVAAPSLAIGSGRAAIWMQGVPDRLHGAGLVCRQVLRWWLIACGLTFVAALIADLSTAANIVSQSGLSGSGKTIIAASTLLVIPNALVYAGAYLLTPGFAVGVGTVVAPGAVVLGPLPAVPILAALPDQGEPAGWVSVLIAIPVLVGVLGAVSAGRRNPTLRWEESALRGGLGGAMAGALFGLVASLAGGSIGPGRMQQIGPATFEVAAQSIVQLGLGGLIGGLVVCAWQRWEADRAE